MDLLARDRAHCWHPYTQHQGMAPPLPIVAASGVWLTEASGRRILDAISSWWVTLHGHAEPAIAEAIARQARTLDQVIFAGCTHAPAVDLAAALVERLPPGLTRIFFSDDGSTAVEAALKMVLHAWVNRGTPRRTLLALDGAYHGDTFGAMSVSGRGLFTEPFDEHLFQVVRLPAPAADDLLPALHRVLDDRGDDVAGLIVEPMLQGAGGMRVWPSGVLAAVARAVQERGIPLIADEVLTGFGRTGPLFAVEHEGVRPDLVCLSKGLTGGFLPLGVTAAREEWFEAFLDPDRRRAFFHGHSYTANPIACAAAGASLALLDAACDARRQAIAELHRARLPAIASHPLVLEPRVLGTIAAFDLAAPGGYLSPIGQDLARFAIQEGILLRPLGATVYILPPYCITADELGSVYDLLQRFLEDVG